MQYGASMQTLDRTATIARIVHAHPSCARVFRRHGIDFCCHGELTVIEACSQKDVGADALFAELEGQLGDERTPYSAPWETDPSALSTPALIDLILSRHHEYLRKVLPFVELLARKVAKVHAHHDAKLPDLAIAVNDLAEEFLAHLDDEERTLFPALLAPDTDRSRVTIERALGSMREDHLCIGEHLGRVRALTNDYAIPEWGCPTYRTFIRQLEAIEGDTFAHVHKENHVLMPRFVAAVSRSAPAVRD